MDSDSFCKARRPRAYWKRKQSENHNEWQATGTDFSEKFIDIESNPSIDVELNLLMVARRGLDGQKDHGRKCLLLMLLNQDQGRWP